MHTHTHTHTHSDESWNNYHSKISSFTLATIFFIICANSKYLYLQLVAIWFVITAILLQQMVVSTK